MCKVRHLKVGHQRDGAAAGDLFAAIANTDHGAIPGKAKDANCWYSYDGKESCTSKFYWVTVTPDNSETATLSLRPNPGSPPNDAIMLGYQNSTDGDEDLYLAVANTKWGEIPEDGS